MDTLRRVGPGLGLALAIALLADVLADPIGALVLSARGIDPTGRPSPISAIPIAVLLGLLVANTVGVPERARPGLTVAVQRALKLGVVLIGLKLSFLEVVAVGAVGVPVVFALVAFALLIALALAARLGVGRRLGSLAAASTAICGITATLAVAPAIDADDREVAYTVANVTILGLLGMLVYPHLAHWLFADQPVSAGLFLGTAIHDTSQVMGAALTYQEVYQDPQAMQVATVAKLTRNSLLVAVVPLLGWLNRGVGAAPSLRKLFPGFVLGFLALSLARTVGDVAFASVGLWEAGVDLLGSTVASLLLATALAGVGLQTRLSVLAGLGARPLLVGVGAAMAVTTASLALAALVGPLLGG